METITHQEALRYHLRAPHGKLEVHPTKPCLTQHDLALAYTPGVAEPCLEIQQNPALAYDYTDKGNTLAVITNGTRVLGLGNIGALAAKPVMEGKAVLFKRFGNIDAFDLEINTQDPEAFIQTVELLEPSFGAVNLEDIKHPDCFHIEDELKQRMKIPVMHDDQHGTAVIIGAALLNALRLAHKRIDHVQIVINGAGASGIACAKFCVSLGAKRENIIMCDTGGVIYEGRGNRMNAYKQQFASQTRARTLTEAARGADVLIGLSTAHAFDEEMLRNMPAHPIVFALSNPIPEIEIAHARCIRPDVLMGTGRSDDVNQINNVLAFPFIFRGAMDVRATQINDAMKVAAAHALADLAHEPVPESVQEAYGRTDLGFGPDYLIPTPFDPRVLPREAGAVAEAAMHTGVARVTVDLAHYECHLEELALKLAEG